MTIFPTSPEIMSKNFSILLKDQQLSPRIPTRHEERWKGILRHIIMRLLYTKTTLTAEATWMQKEWQTAISLPTSTATRETNKTKEWHFQWMGTKITVNLEFYSLCNYLSRMRRKKISQKTKTRWWFWDIRRNNEQSYQATMWVVDKTKLLTVCNNYNACWWKGG